jgi:hypothetical protein
VGPSAPAATAGAAAAAADLSGAEANPGDGAWQAPVSAIGPMGGARMGGGPAQMGRGFGGGRGWMIGGAISITRIDGTKLSLTTVDGWTRTIDAAGATITKAGKTIAASGLAVGDQITFRESRQTDGTFKVTAISVVVPRVAGTVKAVSASTITLTLRDGSTQDVKVTSSTAYTVGGAASDKSAVTVGAQVTAQGTKAQDGTFTALAVDVQPNRLAGTVTATTSTTITVKTQDGTSVTVKVDSNTTYHVAGVTSATIKDIAVDQVLVAVGLRTANDTFQATSVSAGSASSRGVGPGMRGLPFGGGWPGGGRHFGGGPFGGPFGGQPAASPAPSAADGA